MIKTIFQLKNEYSSYENILCKISHEEKRGNIIRLKRGLYETDKTIDPILLSNHIVSPSYVSFETALSYYGLIPEKVYTITGASFNKQKTKLFKNYFGTFTYNDIPKNVYSDSILLDTSKEYGFFIASKEKAILDILYKAKTVKSTKEIETLLFDDLRIDETDFSRLDFTLFRTIGNKYYDKNISLLLQYLKENMNE